MRSSSLFSTATAATRRYTRSGRPTFANISRRPSTDDVVFIHVMAGKWRDSATKKALFKRLAERLAESPGLRPEDVQVIISPNDREDWSFGKGLASYVTEA